MKSIMFETFTIQANICYKAFYLMVSTVWFFKESLLQEDLTSNLNYRLSANSNSLKYEKD